MDGPSDKVVDALLAELRASSATSTAARPLDPGCDESARPITVIDDLPDVPAICQAELDAIERYMGDILDLVLGPAGSATTASSRHKNLP